MKKLISIIILSLNLLQFTNVQCLAKCEVPLISVKGLDLNSTVLEENGFFEKEFDDKLVSVTPINRISGFISDLEQKLANAYKKIVISWNSNLNEKTVDIIGASVKDIFSGKYGTENSEALIKGLEYLKGISMNTTLSDEEKIEAVKEGRIRSEVGLTVSKVTSTLGGITAGTVALASDTLATAAGIASSAIGTGSGALLGATVEVLGNGMAAATTNMASGTLASAITTANAMAEGATLTEAIVAGKITGDVVTTLSTAATVTENVALWEGVAGTAGHVATTVGATVSSVLTPVLIVGATIAAGYGSYKLLNYLTSTIYNKYFSEKPYNEAVVESLKTGNLLNNIARSVCEHEWIGNNVLTVATSKDKCCDKTFANFEKMKGVNYNKTREEINNDFAELECKLLGYPKGHPNNEDCKKEALKSINCYWENIYDTSKCSLNPYLDQNYKNDIEQNADDAKTDNKEL